MVLEDYKDVVGTSAFVTTMAHMLTGTLICKDIYKKGSSKGFDPMPFIGGVGMTILMMRYALIVKDPSMININLFGIILNVAYMSVYYLYSPDKTKVLAQLGKAAAFVGVILGYAQLESEENIEFRYGVLTTGLFLALIASPLLNLGEIIRTKNTEMLPFPMIFMGTLIGVQWFLYGIIIKDSFIIFQNAFGLTLCLIQLSLFVIYPSKPSSEKDKLVTDKKED